MGTVNIPSLNCKWTCPANRWLDKKEGDKQVECDVYPALVEETYVDIVYEEVKVADLDALAEHTDGKEGTTVSYCEDKDGKHVVVEETTTTTTSHEHIRTNNNGDGSHFSSQHHTFKVVPYNEATNDEWRLATVDDVLDSLHEAKNSMDGNEYYLCSLQDGYIGGRGFKYNISGDFKKQEHRLLVKVPAEEVVTCEDAGEEIVQCEEVAEVESCNDAFLDQLVDDTADVSITTTTTTTTDSQHEEVISCEVVPEVESSPSVDLIDKESDVVIQANADILVQNVIETVTSTITTTTYDIEVRTGDKSGAGTDANVFIILFGDKCTTDKIILKDSKTNKKMFERDQVDVFTVECVEVGKIEKITVGHDNKGGFAGWYLSSVKVAHLEFVADRWLDKKEADKQLEVTLFPGCEVAEEVISFETTTEVHNEDESFLDQLDKEGSVSVTGEAAIQADSDSEGSAVDEDEAVTLFKTFDADGDGRITMEEFMEKLKAEKKRKKRKKEEKK